MSRHVAVGFSGSRGAIQIGGRKRARSRQVGGNTATNLLLAIRLAYNVGKKVGDAYKYGKQVATEVDKTLFGEDATKYSNMLPASDATARPLFVGERHTLLKLPNGRPGRSNYMGPGTQVVKRVRRGDTGRTPADNVAKRHDIDYALARDNADVRLADNRMINSLQRIREQGLDSSFNTLQGLSLIGSKTKLEDAGLLSRRAFSGALPKKLEAEERKLLETEKKKLEQQGYGKATKRLPPGLKLKRKLLAQQHSKNKSDKLSEAVREIMKELKL